MVFNICIIDIETLQKKIKEFKNINMGKNPSYLIMNNETFYELNHSVFENCDDFKYECVITENRKKEGKRIPHWGPNYPTFQKIDIAICNELKFGEVDIV